MTDKETTAMIIGRINALELMHAQILAMIMCGNNPNGRAAIVKIIQDSLEDRTDRLSEEHRAAFMDTADRILSSAMATCRGLEEASPSEKTGVFGVVKPETKAPPESPGGA